MGKFSKSKGYRVEHKLVKEFNKAGIKARRQPMSGAIADFPYDIEIKDERFHKLSVEVKARKNGDGFKTLEKWKSGADLLCLHKDHGTTMVCLDLPLFIDILKQDEL
ncbi:Archaeal Holliday junction resolvase [uncultured Mediterranean phage uvMED]|jgi:hypothetical protein|nr:Archaeal Holliday junction resolvase [uncultured Mediterranean phage uvMED]|tara:strand:+ start:144 stop:464 length:321 start_codon:yes stop_codon:yes gene_type:complete